jgi:hypothetical protein
MPKWKIFLFVLFVVLMSFGLGYGAFEWQTYDFSWDNEY